MRGARALGPAQRQRQRALRRLVGRRIRQAFVERHRDVGAERALDLHDRLRREKARRAVERRAELDPVVADLADLREAEDLEATGVGQNGATPSHEAMEAAEITHDVGAGAQQQVVGIAEHDLRAGGVEVLGRERLDGRLRADRHEDGCIDDAMGGRETAAAGGAVRRRQLEAHGGSLVREAASHRGWPRWPDTD